jgi:hypothetical protein
MAEWGALLLHIQVTVEWTMAVLTKVPRGILQNFQANDRTLSQIKPSLILCTIKHSGLYNPSY